MYESINVFMFICQHIFLPMDLQFGMQLLALYKTKTNKKKQKKNLTENFWFGAQRFVWFSLSFFFVFLGFEIEKHKKPCVFFWFLVPYGSKECTKKHKNNVFCFSSKTMSKTKPKILKN